ncbi:MAG: radical SAM protein [Candidatus Eremiobacteraeota bacterium]|nr:radical SAM protein [Candidatus Eremiobacteraeota bacterium]
MEILKEKTTGLCSECYRKVDAQVIAENDKVVILKSCPEHGVTKGVLERDVDFFRRVISVKRVSDPCPYPFRTLMINITHGCNLKCHLCYLPERDTSLDFTLDELKKAIREYRGATVTLSGGEPTTREDLLEIISYVRSQGKIAGIVTNGVKLADIRFVEKIREAGCTLVNFSCNGLNEESFTKIENANLLETKLKGLENLKKVGGIFCQLSYTMVRGINDDQLGELTRYALENNDFIYQIRARVATGIGRRMGEKDIYLSDFVKYLAREIRMPYEYLMAFWTSTMWFPNTYLFDFDYYAFLEHPIIREKLGYKKNGPESMTRYLARYIGEENARNIQAYKDAAEKKGLVEPNFVYVIFSWPDKHTMDYEETKALNLDILLRDGTVTEYWDGIIRNEKFAIL